MVEVAYKIITLNVLCSCLRYIPTSLHTIAYYSESKANPLLVPEVFKPKKVLRNAKPVLNKNVLSVVFTGLIFTASKMVLIGRLGVEIFQLS